MTTVHSPQRVARVVVPPFVQSDVDRRDTP